MAFRSFLRPGEAIYAHPTGTQTNTVICNHGNYRLILQADGNLVLYREHVQGQPYGEALWHSHTHNTPASVCYMQTDGNLVVYAGTTPLWNSNTAGFPGAFLAVQDDGNVVIYAPGNIVLWQTNTLPPDPYVITAPGPPLTHG
jgi:hypothetical protein